MKRQAYQHPELRDANDNIIQEGTYGKASPLVNGDNTGVLDYINNNLEALHDAQTAAGNAITTGGLTVTGTVTTSGLTVSGKTSVPTAKAGNSSKAIANTEYVQGELTNYKDVERVNASGSNYIRYESGLQICWGSSSVVCTLSGTTAFPYYGQQTMTYPQAFVNTPAVMVNVLDWPQYWNATASTANTSQCVVMVAGNNNTQAKIFRYVAIGRWK